jgi:hypothetical protein
LDREPRRGVPEILGRLRRDAEEQLDPPTAPGWARPVGWIVAAGIVVVVVIMLMRANPL